MASPRSALRILAIFGLSLSLAAGLAAGAQKKGKGGTGRRPPAAPAPEAPPSPDIPPPATPPADGGADGGGQEDGTAGSPVEPGAAATVPAIPVPAPAGASAGPVPAGEEPYEGFGVNPGGGSGAVVEAGTAEALRSALGQSNVVVRVKPGDYHGSFLVSKGSLTLDGGGATIYGDRQGLQVHAHDVIVRNLRLRNTYDNIDTGGGAAKNVTQNVVFSHVTVSGSADDGMSLAYGASDMTVQYCAFFGNSRSCFIKYGATRVSVHHSWFRGQWIRGALVNAALVDFRNNVQEEFALWGTRFEDGATGNAINNVYNLTYAPGKPDSSLYTASAGPVCFKGNVGRGKAKPQNNGGAEIEAPKVTTHSAEEAERIVRERAGCRPLDEVDRKILNLKQSAGNGRGLRP